MSRILHIITRTDDATAQAVVDAQRASGSHELEIADLTHGEIDYHKLLDAVFAADSVEVW